MSETIRILLVEDHRGTREALAAALGVVGLEVVGAFSTGEAALAALPALQPDVALLDLGLPGISGAETIRRLKQLRPKLPVLVLSVFREEERIVEAIEAGAGGYLLKDTPPAEIRRAVEQVREGMAPLSPEVARHVLAVLRSRRAASPEFQLTDRELEVLDLLSRGHSYHSIAAALGIQFGTVQSHVKNVYRKLEVSSKAEAAALAVKHGLIRG